MLTRNKLQRGKGKLKSFDPEAEHVAQRWNIEYEEAQMEEQWNYCDIFFTMAEKVDKLFAEY